LPISSPSWLATQPPTPITRSGFFCLQLLPAAELVEHLLLGFFPDGAGVEQHDIGLLASRRDQVDGWDSPSRSRMRAESYSFIWQPWVLMYSFFAIPMHSVIRIDEVEKEGTAKITDSKGGNVTPFPLPLPSDGGKS
jgi:hypothetical protein